MEEKGAKRKEQRLLNSCGAENGVLRKKIPKDKHQIPTELKNVKPKIQAPNFNNMTLRKADIKNAPGAIESAELRPEKGVLGYKKKNRAALLEWNPQLNKPAWLRNKIKSKGKT